MNGVKEKEQRNREKNNNTERNKQLKKTEVFFKFYAWLKQRKDRSQKKNLFLLRRTCVASNSYHYARERWRRWERLIIPSSPSRGSSSSSFRSFWWTTKAALLCPRFRANQSRNRPICSHLLLRPKRKQTRLRIRRRERRIATTTSSSSKWAPKRITRENTNLPRLYLLLLRCRRAEKERARVRHRGKISRVASVRN